MCPFLALWDPGHKVQAKERRPPGWGALRIWSWLSKLHWLCPVWAQSQRAWQFGGTIPKPEVAGNRGMREDQQLFWGRKPVNMEFLHSPNLNHGLPNEKDLNSSFYICNLFLLGQGVYFLLHKQVSRWGKLIFSSLKTSGVSLWFSLLPYVERFW